MQNNYKFIIVFLWLQSGGLERWGPFQPCVPRSTDFKIKQYKPTVCGSSLINILQIIKYSQEETCLVCVLQVVVSDMSPVQDQKSFLVFIGVNSYHTTPIIDQHNTDNLSVPNKDRSVWYHLKTLMEMQLTHLLLMLEMSALQYHRNVTSSVVKTCPCSDAG